jgi:hypothetical protein
MKTFMLSYPDKTDRNQTRYLFEVAQNEEEARTNFRNILKIGRLPNFSNIVELQVEGTHISESRNSLPVEIDWNDEIVMDFANQVWNLAQGKFASEWVTKEEKAVIVTQLNRFKRKSVK